MKLSIGIIGLPNVGKTALFNALTNSKNETQSYMFSTVEPNIGIVPLPDKRLEILSQISESQKITPATVEFVDISGLVKGSSKGEGLGNKFLASIRETSVIAHVVRCFEDKNVAHVSATLDPNEDIEIINLELILSDLELCQRALTNQEKKAKNNKPEDIAKKKALEKIESYLSQNKPVRQLTLTEEEQRLLKEYHFLTAKKVIYIANVNEDELSTVGRLAQQVKTIALENQDAFLQISAKLEAELSELSETDKQELLASYGIQASGLESLTQQSFHLLGLQTFLTTGKKETRAWTIPIGATAPQAAGEIHSDLERGFIRANIVSYEDLISCKNFKIAKEKGLLRQEGKEYIMKESDVVEFLFNV